MNNYKKNYNCIKIIAALIAFMLFIAALSSCNYKNNNKKITDNTEEKPDDEVVSYINDTNIGVKEQQISDLYENAGVNAKLIPRDPFDLTLSHNNYFYSDSIYVEIKSGIENAEIYYTLDSSTPSKNNIGTSKKNGIIKGSRKYGEPVFLEKTDNNAPYVLKVIAYSEDRESRMITHTYFVSNKIDERFDENTFVFSVSSEPDNFYGYENGILIEGKLRDDWKKAHPGRNPDPPESANYNLRGMEGEREAYVEVFKSDGRLLISQTAGVRVHGAWSRAADRKSLRIYARSEYDNIFGRFYYPFFGEHKRNDEYGSFIYDYKTILLRNGANDRGQSFMREEFAQGLAKQAGLLDYHEFAPAAVFVNGEYYGFFWLQYTYNEDYFINSYGGDNKSLYEILEHWEEPDLTNLVSAKGFENFTETYDADNFILYYALEIYAKNWDWPHNNRKAWRYIGEDGTYINKYYDGKLRMLFFDAEGGWGDWSGMNEMTIQRIKNDNSAPVFTALMRRADMREKFCNQMFDLFNSVLLYENIEKEQGRIVDLYDYEISVAVKKRVLGNSMDNIKNDQKNIMRFVRRREMTVTADMKESFNLSGDTYDVKVKGKSGADIALNTLKLSGAGNLKSYYFTEHSVILKAEIHAGYLFDCWEINGEKYYESEVELNGKLAVNGVINAELFTKPDETYHDIVIKTIKLDTDCDIIVLFNPGLNETIIKDLYLSNDKKDLKKFNIKRVRFPAKSIMTYYGQNYAGEDIQNIKANHIFDFKIKKGETVYLSDKNGKILQEVYVPESFNVDRNEEISRNDNGTYEIIKAGRDTLVAPPAEENHE